MQRLVHRFAIMPFQFCFIHERKKLKKSLHKKTNWIYMHVWVKLNRKDLPKFYNPNEQTQMLPMF